jgi:outer membrane protein OmpA-like peptidoglycan-associated protein
MVSAKGEIAYLASNRPGGYGDLDIYYFNLPEEIKPTKTFYFDGLVFDIKTRKALAGHFQLIDIESGQVVIISDADKTDGSFMVALPINRDYAISVSYPGYFPYSLNFNLSIAEGQENYHIDIPLNPETSTTENVLSNVFFDRSQSSLRENSKIELLGLVLYLKQNPQHKIELGGHTDSRGNNNDNLILSSERAKSVYEFLVSNGIDANRLSYRGYGSTQTIISDIEIEKMMSNEEKEKAHQKNRRTVYKIIL